MYVCPTWDNPLLAIFHSYVKFIRTYKAVYIYVVLTLFASLCPIRATPLLALFHWDVNVLYINTCPYIYKLNISYFCVSYTGNPIFRENFMRLSAFYMGIPSISHYSLNICTYMTIYIYGQHYVVK